MIKLLICFLSFFILVIPVSALELEPPQVPDAGIQIMPEGTDSFSDGLSELLKKAFLSVQPDLAEALQIAATVICIVLVFSMLQSCYGKSKKVITLAGSVSITAMLLESTGSLIRLGASTITDMSEYGKLLLPVMTAAMAGQGGTATSTALYVGTAAFDVLLTNLISECLVPATYFYLALAAANSAIGEDILKRLRDFLKWIISWTLKILLTVFTTYMGISGAVSGTTDAVALKATKLTIASMIPVVGGILSDASEAVLVSAGLAKNAAGLYGIFAVLAVFLVPFLKIGIQYTVLKLTAALGSLLGEKTMAELIEDFSSAMGLLLAMTGSVCLMLLISTICFLKGVSG